MGKLGRRGIFSTGASLGGGGGISTPSNFKIVHKLDISFENEMELQSEILKLKSLGIQLENEQELSADLKIARKLGISLENEQELSADLKIVRGLGISFENEMELQSEILMLKSLGIQFENEQELFADLTLGGIDPDAQTFITAHETDTGVSMNAIQQKAINGFVTRLKGIGTTHSTNFWSGAFNVTSIYPYCPSNDSTASAAGYKLDLLRVNDITYTNFIAGDFTPTGATGGAGKIANTGIGIDAAAYNDYMISFYSRDLSASGRVMGALNAAATRALDPAFTGATTYNNFYRNTGSSSDAITNTQGLFTESQNKQYRNTTQFGNRQSANFSLDNKDIYLHSRNFNGAPNAPISNEFAGFAVGTKNFTAAAIQDWFECWDWYQTNVITGGRNV